jgi:hypothetical protein
VQQFKEIYHLFPYFHEINGNVIVKSEYIRDYSLFVNFMNKYFGEEILSAPSKSEKNSKIAIPLKNSINSMQFKKIEFPNPEIKKINVRVYLNYFRFLDLNDMPNYYFKYNIPNYAPNNNPIGKISKKLNSIVYEIEKSIERQKINSDLHTRKKVSMVL